MDEATLKPYLKKDVAITMAGQRIEFAVSQTLFSSHQVDIGSAHLLKTLPLDLIGDKARILDLGCGYGPLRADPGAAQARCGGPYGRSRRALAVDFLRSMRIASAFQCKRPTAVGYDDVELRL